MKTDYLTERDLEIAVQEYLGTPGMESAMRAALESLPEPEPQGAVLRLIDADMTPNSEGYFREFYRREGKGFQACAMTHPQVSHFIDILLPTDDGRKEFEVELLKLHNDVDVRFEAGVYFNLTTRYCWEVWQAARRAGV